MDYSLEDEEFQDWVLRVAGLLIVLPVLLFLTVGQTGIEVFSAIATSLLSLALVVLYFQQSSLLEKQTELLHRDYQSTLGIHGQSVADEDEITVKLKNAGRGKIRRIYLKSEIVSDTGDLDVVFGRVPMKNIENGSLELAPDSDYEKFSGKTTFRILSLENFENDRPFSFKMVSRLLSQRGISSCTLKLTLQVVDEGVIDDQFSYEVDLAEQELYFDGAQTVERDGEEKERHQATSVEDGIESDYSSTQDINRMSWEEVGL